MAVLPLLRRRGLDATCLVIGAMAPDFQYFVHGQERGEFGHTLLGVWLWGVPVTLVVALLFHAFVKYPLWLVAPRAIAQRTAREAIAPWPARWSIGVAASLVASAAIGNYTHLAWDGLTHAAGWGEHLFPRQLDRWVTIPVVGGRMIVYRVLQYVSSLIGLAGVAWYAVFALARRPVVEIERRTAGPRLVFAACLAAGVAVLVARAVVILHATDPGSIVVAACSGLLAGTLVGSALVRAGGAISPA